MNLVAQIGEPDKTAIMETLKALMKAYEERYLPSADIADNSSFVRLGLTDAGILELVGKDNPLITADLSLYLAAASSGDHALNFNHLRLEYLLD